MALLAGVLIFAAITAFMLGNRGSGFVDTRLELMVPIGVAVTAACTGDAAEHRRLAGDRPGVADAAGDRFPVRRRPLFGMPSEAPRDALVE